MSMLPSVDANPKILDTAYTRAYAEARAKGYLVLGTEVFVKGFVKGYIEGYAKGLFEGVFSSIKALMKVKNLPAEKAMVILHIPEIDRSVYLAALAQS